MATTCLGTLQPLCWHTIPSLPCTPIILFGRANSTSCQLHAYHKFVRLVTWGMVEISAACAVFSTVPHSKAPHDCRYLLVLPNRMQKVICNFNSFKEEHKADFDTIVAAYAAANQAAVQSHPNPPFIVTTPGLPKLGRHRYEVYVKPLGYSALCTNEQVSVKASRHSLL